MNLGKLKATDMLNNPRIFLPKPRPHKEEAKLEAKEHMYMQTWMKFMTQNCNKKGDQTESNLTEQELRGQAKINKRQESGEIIISNPSISLLARLNPT